MTYRPPVLDTRNWTWTRSEFERASSRLRVLSAFSIFMRTSDLPHWRFCCCGHGWVLPGARNVGSCFGVVTAEGNWSCGRKLFVARAQDQLTAAFVLGGLEAVKPLLVEEVRCRRKHRR